MFKCPHCGKPYKQNGKWIRKHMIEVCHVRSLRGVELFDASNLIGRIEYLEKIIKSGKISRFASSPIERIKNEEESKVDPATREFRQVFSEVMNELKEVLKKRNEGLGIY